MVMDEVEKQGNWDCITVL